MLLFPLERALVVAELAFPSRESRAVQADAPPVDHGGNQVMQKLVIHDVRDEVPRHPLVVEGRVDADQALGGAVAPELDGSALLAARSRVPPQETSTSLMLEPK